MSSGPAAWRVQNAASFLRAPSSDSHKYSRGALGVRTGSSAYPGAAVLGVEAAWRTGVGLVHYVSQLDDVPPQNGLPSPAAAILAIRPETIFTSASDGTLACDAWLIGSGTNATLRTALERTALLRLLAGDAPVVVDAGALDLVVSSSPTAPVIVTPHAGEFRSIWRSAGLPHSQSQDENAVSQLARHLGVTVLLKGSRTLVASPGGRQYECGPATPWLATAGTGDVLAGILGTLAATHAEAVAADPESLAQLGATSAVLHDLAARIASGDETGNGEGHAITALDVAHAIPSAFTRIRE